MRKHHYLDIKPIPENVLYINEPGLVDTSLLDIGEEEIEDKRVRVYVPLDLSPDDIMRRLNFLIYRYGEANENNESDFRMDVNQLVRQIEIYDQIIFARTCRHCTEFMEKFINRLRKIPDGCAESFPFELVEELEKDWNIGHYDKKSIKQGIS